MNVAKHFGWAMNPNLSPEDFQRLVEQDAQRELERLRDAGQEAIKIAREHGRLAGIQYLNYALPYILCS